MKPLCLLFLTLSCFAGCAYQPRPLSPAEEHARQEAFMHRVDEELAALAHRPSPARILVTTGPLFQLYEILGEVRADTTSILLSTADLRDRLFRSPFSIAVQGASPKLSYAQMDERLKQRPIEQYGDQVTAVINVTYPSGQTGMCSHRGWLSA